MYSQKPSVNILTALLLAYGIEDAVVCPGSRNAILVHNLMATQQIRLHAITDERSAAFVAIGMWLKTRRPIVVCVTSGSALLNTLPGVAEATMRQIPLVVISADRPAEWIGQLDGQTLPQVGALQPYAATWQLSDDERGVQEQWTQRLVHEALTTALSAGGHPVHINVPLAEPIFRPTCSTLPVLQPRHRIATTVHSPLSSEIITLVQQARLPVLMMGAWDGGKLEVIERLRRNHKMLVYAEILSGQGHTLMAQKLDREPVCPDVVVQVGGAYVNKQYKEFLRSVDCKVIYIAESLEPADTFQHLVAHVLASPQQALLQLEEALLPNAQIEALHAQIDESGTRLRQWEGLEAIFLGNSMTVRWANRYFAHSPHRFFGNRGTNGIEGSLSVAAGYSLMANDKVLCILGDLSFFYDVNALWNKALDGRLRVLLVNNGCGEIFNRLPAMQGSPALQPYIAAAHSATARGIAQSYGCHYYAETIGGLDEVADRVIDTLLALEADRPIIYELFTPHF